MVSQLISLAPISPSVYLSVCHTGGSKTVEVSIMQILPYGSPNSKRQSARMSKFTNDGLTRV